MRLSLPSRLNSVTLVNAALVVLSLGGAWWAYSIVSGPAAAAASTDATTQRSRPALAVSGAVGSSSGSSGSNSQANAASSSSSSSSSSGFIQLADLTKLQINASFAEADATKLKADQVANVTWSALSGTRATGKVST